ncbi:amino acid ABC transporter periplasmic amino acid-binding protein [Streptococcus pneumoniae]|nr:amino acid ABC transporter periplasmic amino acid-binding protein [Streptococcus pneumoniae]
MVDGKNQIVGSDIELAKAIATELGVELELSPMSFDNVLASVQSGKADLAISGVSKTDERSKVFDFSTPYYTAKNKLIVKLGAEKGWSAERFDSRDDGERFATKFFPRISA